MNDTSFHVIVDALLFAAFAMYGVRIIGCLERRIDTLEAEVWTLQGEVNDEGPTLGGGYHSCDGPCCEKRPGEYCSDDDCNCGAAGDHATLPKPHSAERVDGDRWEPR